MNLIESMSQIVEESHKNPKYKEKCQVDIFRCSRKMNGVTQEGKSLILYYLKFYFENGISLLIEGRVIIESGLKGVIYPSIHNFRTLAEECTLPEESALRLSHLETVPISPLEVVKAAMGNPLNLTDCEVLTDDKSLEWTELAITSILKSQNQTEGWSRFAMKRLSEGLTTITPGSVASAVTSTAVTSSNYYFSLHLSSYILDVLKVNEGNFLEKAPLAVQEAIKLAYAIRNSKLMTANNILMFVNSLYMVRKILIEIKKVMKRCDTMGDKRTTINICESQITGIDSPYSNSSQLNKSSSNSFENLGKICNHIAYLTTFVNLLKQSGAIDSRTTLYIQSSFDKVKEVAKQLYLKNN